jgi:hypothetical protein
MTGFVRGLDGRAGQGKIPWYASLPPGVTKMLYALGSRPSGEKRMLKQFRKVRAIGCISTAREAVVGVAKRLATGLEPSIDVSEFDRRIAPLERALGLDKTASESKSLRRVFGPI